MKRRTKKILMLTCSVCAVACLAFTGWQAGKIAPHASAATAEDIALSQELETQYLVGEILQIPTATITYEGNPYAADETVSVYCPDGSVLSGTRFTLEQTGNYTIVYETTIAGVRVTAEKTFVVVDETYTMPSSCSYAYAETVKTQDPAQFAEGGLNVELSMGAEFVYNQTIDISSASLDTPVVTFAPYQYSNYMLDAQGRPAVQANEFYVRLTDAYDEDNYIELYMLNRSKDLSTHEPGRRSYPYLSVGASGQTKYALDVTSRYDPKFDNGRLVNVDGSDYAAVYENFGVNHGLVPYGQAVGNNGDGNDGQGGYFSLYYDSATARIYVTAPIRNGAGAAVIKQIFLNDLDNANLYPSNAFKGFTTGEVKLSIRADDYQSDKMQFELLEVYGNKGAALAATGVSDTRAPLLEFDEVDEGQSFLVKKNAVVKLPTATAYDVHLKGDVETRAYYGYGTDKQLLVNSDGGEFTPTKTGAYTVEYIAVDTYGNKTMKTLLFSCVEQDVLQFSTEEAESGFKAGASLSLPAYELKSLNGATHLDVYATFAGERIDIDADTLEFFVDYVGEYTITYAYGDALTSGTYSYKVTSVASENIVFGAFNLPKYFIKDAEYTLDTVYAYTYLETEPVARKTDVYVKEDDGTFERIDFASYTVDANESVQFKYAYGGVETTSKVLPVVDVGFGGKLDTAKYLAGNVSATAEKKYVEVRANATTGDTTVQFINPVAFSLFRFEFNVPEETANFDGVEIRLTDYYDSDISVVIGYYKGADITQFKVDDASVDLTYTFTDNDFAVWYERSAGKMMEKSGATFDFENVFTSDRIFVEFTLKNLNGDSALRLLQIGNQPMTNNGRDRYPAAFSYQNLFGGLNEIDKTVTVYAGEATDVLSPYCESKMRVSVTTPAGEYVTALDGTLLNGASATKDYEFVTAEYGLYLVNYSYFDQYMNEVTGMYYIKVVDMQSPTIVLDNGYDESTRVIVDAGDDVEIAGYTASDNVTATGDLQTQVFVLKANGEFVQLEDGSFHAKDKGDYIVYYYCYDTDQNYTIVKYYVRAE